MENSFQTSFIPKKPIIVNDKPKKEPTSIFSVIAIIILVLSVLISGLLFGYKFYLNNQIVELSKQLLQAKDSFEKDTIEELNTFNERTKSAKDILSNHVAFSKVFEVLGKITIPEVQYTKFESQINDKGILVVNVTGLASDYRSIAVQADVFSSSKGSAFKNVLFSNLSKNKDNTISFNLEFNVERSVYLYSKSLTEDTKVGINEINTQ